MSCLKEPPTFQKEYVCIDKKKQPVRISQQSDVAMWYTANAILLEV